MALYMDNRCSAGHVVSCSTLLHGICRQQCRSASTMSNLNKHETRWMDSTKVTVSTSTSSSITTTSTIKTTTPTVAARGSRAAPRAVTTGTTAAREARGTWGLLQLILRQQGGQGRADTIATTAAGSPPVAHWSYC